MIFLTLELLLALNSDGLIDIFLQLNFIMNRNRGELVKAPFLFTKFHNNLYFQLLLIALSAINLIFDNN